MARSGMTSDILHQATWNASPDPVVLAEATTGEIIEVNNATSDVLGYADAELRGEPIETLHPRGQADRYRELFERHVEAASEEAHTYRELPDGGQIYVETKTGSHIPVEINATVFERDGQAYITGIFRDVTERKRRERDLELHETAVEHGGHAIYWTDANGQIEYVNQAFERLTGYDREEAVGRNPRFLQSGAHEESFYDLLWETILSGDVWRSEIINERKDGTRFVVDQTIAPVTDEVGRPRRFVAINTDVTDRYERETELKRFRKAVEQAGHAIYITDADGTIQFVNPAFEAITGYTSTEALGQTPRILRSGEQPSGYYEDLWETLLDGEIWEEEVVNQRADGTTYSAHQTIAPITTPAGDVESFVAVQRDISELKAYEDELERKNERLDSFAKVVSHDLRNPLTVAEGRIKLAQKDGADADLDTALDAIEQMKSLIDDLLLLAREGSSALDLARVSLSEYATRSWQHVDTADARLLDRTTRTIQADPTRLGQIFENLFRNAIEHGGPDVSITVGDLPDGFYIEDDGAGIPVDAREQVFEEGYSTESDGTGFGLPIVMKSAQAHGWSIEVTESDAGGARFEFRGVESD